MEFSWNPNSNALEPVGCCVAAQLPVLSPSSILLPPLYHCTFIPKRKSPVHISKNVIIFFLFPPLFLKVVWIWCCKTLTCISQRVSVMCDEAWHFPLRMLGSVSYVVQKSFHWIEMCVCYWWALICGVSGIDCLEVCNCRCFVIRVLRWTFSIVWCIIRHKHFIIDPLPSSGGLLSLYG